MKEKREKEKKPRKIYIERKYQQTTIRLLTGKRTGGLGLGGTLAS